ncbi:glycosyl hydrolase [Robiginitalea sp. SC105]|uniref:WD40/YVTN/BNR-like repeat-containing protein n=1 Tax=Robiginitalea sp. SC105 TaxID=2762332 RepID=UPI00163A2AF4|nr:glycosyl hydrolase [Robiginitalea sp. SC105]MBC2837813.1 glycosyl hydrolase [Robiginitalea sp. SC105]
MRTTFRRTLALPFLGLLASIYVHAQQGSGEVYKELASGLKLREIGPALMGGRIADLAVNPRDKSNWYVAVGSGGVWKTSNSGTTWEPVFDHENSYSIGCVAIDPANPNIVWVGTGENVSGRHVGWGDGVYKSLDGGQTWQNMGLGKSEHIGRILIDPRDSDVIYVAAEGPLWSSGGDRGLYKSTDGGATWVLSLKIDADTGVTDVEFDPSNPDVVYAAAYQRRRHTWSLLAGGPQSGIYKSTDSGTSWRLIKTGLPKGDMGKIGLAVTPADPERVYATIEADEKERGFYRSMDKGESWEKRNSYISGGTGPHYYQELEASPANPDLVYQMDVFLHVTRDGGKTIDYLGTGREKHSDNHALWIDPDNGKHLLAGSDGGLYESFDEGLTWRHFPNLPISQFYKISLDNAEPFFNVVAGAQDLGTLIGPSRTTHTEGVRNQDWYVPLGADGYDCAFDPTDPDIVYMEIQEGMLYRLDRATEETLFIQPEPAPGEAPERYNWDSPILISPHDPKTIYYGSQRVWRSNDRGDSWTPVSGDLTTNRVRYELKMFENVPGVDALHDTGAMSKYATLTSISESPLKKGLLYTGSDDGLVHISEDGGMSWRRAPGLPKVPALSFINDVEASGHDPRTVFVVADAHKLGDFSTYLFMSNDGGASWKSIRGDLPANTTVWVIKQDHVDENLLFIGAEYGLYFSPNKGENWIRLGAGVPTIPFQDVELHPRDNDLVGATFGRGIYVLDDYSALREAGKVAKSGLNALFSVRDAWWYVPNVPSQAKGMPTAGSTSFRTPNPPHGALLTYYIGDLPKTARQKREEKEKELRTQGADIPFPGWDVLKSESLDTEPKVLLLISDAEGRALRWLKGASEKGVHRTHWDLRLAAPDPIDLSQPSFIPPWVEDPQGPLVAPGTYSAQLYLVDNGQLRAQGNPQSFKVKPTPQLRADTNYELYAAFTQKTADLARSAGAAGRKLGEAAEKLRYMEEALVQTPSLEPSFFEQLKNLNNQISTLRESLYGDPIRSSKNEATAPSVAGRIWSVSYGHWGTTQLPTATQQRSIDLAGQELENVIGGIEAFENKLAAFESSLVRAGAPYTPGRKID